MRKIVVIGSSGAGKSTFATTLGEKYGLPVFHLDKLFWLPGWVERPKAEMAIDVEKILVEHGSWVMDGNYKRVGLESRIKAADLIFVLDFNPYTCIYRAIKRNFLHWGKTRVDMQEGCPEKRIPDRKFIRYIWRYRKDTLLPILKVLELHPEKKVIIFKKQDEVDRWFKSI